METTLRISDLSVGTRFLFGPRNQIKASGPLSGSLFEGFILDKHGSFIKVRTQTRTGDWLFEWTENPDESWRVIQVIWEGSPVSGGVTSTL